METATIKNRVAYITWAIVSVCALYAQIQFYGVGTVLWLCAALQLAVLVGITLTIQDRSRYDGLVIRSLGMLLQAVAAIALSVVLNQSFITIYTIVLAGQLHYFFAMRRSLLVVAIIMTAYYCVWHFYWLAADALVETALWSSFHLFSLMVNYGLNREQQQKEQALAINRELKGTQSLLQEAAKQDERFRIARDLHDRLGHQLTALSIQLDVLRRSCPEPYQQQAESSYSLAQELLHSIRNTVSDLREDHMVDLAAALKTLVQGIPDLDVSLDWPNDIQIDSLQQAEALFYCVQEASTNTLKHAQARRLSIRARTQADHLNIWVKDDGQAPDSLVPGNGIKGMRERMAAIKGQFNLEASETGTVVRLSVPLSTVTQ